MEQAKEPLPELTLGRSRPSSDRPRARPEPVLIGGMPQADNRVRVRRVPWQSRQRLAPGAAAPDAGAALTNAMGR